MADKFTAAESIRRIAAFVAPMLEAAEQLEAMGKAEQTIKEAVKARDSAIEDTKLAQQDAERAKDDVKAAKQSAKDIVNKANDQALAKLGEADQKAQAIIDAGAAKANQIVAQATDSAVHAQATIAGKIAQLTAQEAKLKESVGALSVALEKLNSDTEVAANKLTRIQTAIQKYAQVG